MTAKIYILRTHSATVPPGAGRGEAPSCTPPSSPAESQEGALVLEGKSFIEMTRGGDANASRNAEADESSVPGGSGKGDCDHAAMAAKTRILSPGAGAGMIGAKGEAPLPLVISLADRLAWSVRMLTRGGGLTCIVCERDIDPRHRHVSVKTNAQYCSVEHKVIAEGWR